MDNILLWNEEEGSSTTQSAREYNELWKSKFKDPMIPIKQLMLTAYTNSLVNVYPFYSNFTITTFQKIPIPQLTRTMKQKFLHLILYELIPLNLGNTKLGKHNFFPEPKVALTKDLVYIQCKLKLCKAVTVTSCEWSNALINPVHI